jgi:hypothetical protein
MRESVIAASANTCCVNFVSNSKKAAKSGRRKLVYTGTAMQYTNKRFDTGTCHQYSIVSYDVTGNVSRGVPVVIQPSVLSPSAEGRRRRSRAAATRLGQGEESELLLQLYRGGEMILSTWPSAARLALHRRWVYSGRSFRLRPGTYSWYIWPAFGPRSKVRYGHLLGQSGFRVG